MPDYKPQGTLYWWTMVSIGVLVLLHCVGAVAAFAARAAADRGGRCHRHAGGLLPGAHSALDQLLRGRRDLHLPRAADARRAGRRAGRRRRGALVGSWRTSKRWTSRIASPAMAIVSMIVAGSLLELVLGALHAASLYNDGLLLTAAMAFSVVYFVLNTVLATASSLKRNQPMVLRRCSPTSAGSRWPMPAARHGGLAAVPHRRPVRPGRADGGGAIVGLLLATLHFFFRQQEADEAMRRSRVEAVESAKAAQAALRAGAGGEANSASTAPSRTPRSAWRWCRPRRGAPGQPCARPRCSGRARETLVGQRLDALVHADDASTLAASWRACTAARSTPSPTNCAAATTTAATCGWRWTRASSTRAGAGTRALIDADAGHHGAAQRRGAPASTSPSTTA